MRRRILAAMGGAAWKNPYITDGLVGMWDGNYTDGEVKDIISGTTATLPTTIKYDKDSLGWLFSDNATISYGLSDDAKAALKSATNTIELNFKTTPFTSVDCRNPWLVGGVINNVTYSASSTNTATYWLLAFYGRTNSAVQPMDADRNYNGTFALACSAASMYGTMYTKGLQASSASFSAIPTTDATAIVTSLRDGTIVRSMRIYNCALTIDQIKANWAVDKERFGLS